MKTLFCLILCLCFCIDLHAQTDLQKLVDTEHAFAQFAADHSTKEAFLKYIADDGVLFQPDKINGKMYWNNRGPSVGLLSWAPNYADISANGVLGYTTGNWEYRPKGKTDAATAFGEFITVWQRQPDGQYRFVIDIGVGHPKPDKFSTDWVTTSETTKDLNGKNSALEDNVNGRYASLTDKGMVAKAYDECAADDIRWFREDKAPMIGKKPLLSLLKSEKAIFSFSKRISFFGSSDLAYTTNTYTKSVDGTVVEKGNTMQIWKLIKGRWRIVLDIFKPVPQK